MCSQQGAAFSPGCLSLPGVSKAPGRARGVWDCLELSQEQRQAEREKNPSTPKLVSSGTVITKWFLPGSGLMGSLNKTPGLPRNLPGGGSALVWTCWGIWGAPILCRAPSSAEATSRRRHLPYTRGGPPSKTHFSACTEVLASGLSGPLPPVPPCHVSPHHFPHLPWTRKPSYLCSDPTLLQACPSFRYPLSESTSNSLPPHMSLSSHAQDTSFPAWPSRGMGHTEAEKQGGTKGVGNHGFQDPRGLLTCHLLRSISLGLQLGHLMPLVRTHGMLEACVLMEGPCRTQPSTGEH